MATPQFGTQVIGAQYGNGGSTAGNTGAMDNRLFVGFADAVRPPNLTGRAPAIPRVARVVGRSPEFVKPWARWIEPANTRMLVARTRVQLMQRRQNVGNLVSGYARALTTRR